jgi:hypothetical protein
MEMPRKPWPQVIAMLRQGMKTGKNVAADDRHVTPGHGNAGNRGLGCGTVRKRSERC